MSNSPFERTTCLSPLSDTIESFQDTRGAFSTETGSLLTLSILYYHIPCATKHFKQVAKLYMVTEVYPSSSTSMIRGGKGSKEALRQVRMQLVLEMRGGINGSRITLSDYVIGLPGQTLI